MVSKERRKEAFERLEKFLCEMDTTGVDFDVVQLVEDIGTCFQVVSGLEEQVSLYSEICHNAQFDSRSVRADLQEAQLKVIELRRQLYNLEVEHGVGYETF